jgi:hypothetical protein
MGFVEEGHLSLLADPTEGLPKTPHAYADNKVILKAHFTKQVEWAFLLLR